MCLRNLLSGFLFLAACSSLSGQSFDPSVVYEVTGAELNRLEADLLTAQNELAKSKAENERLQKKIDADLIDRQTALTGLQTQLQTVSLSWERSKQEALSREVIIGGVAALVGFAIGWGLR